jgi:hypothetical protein
MNIAMDCQDTLKNVLCAYWSRNPKLEKCKWLLYMHSERMGPCQFSWLPSEAQVCIFQEVRKLWGLILIRRRKIILVVPQ